MRAVGHIQVLGDRQTVTAEGDICAGPSFRPRPGLVPKSQTLHRAENPGPTPLRSAVSGQAGARGFSM